MVLFIIAKTNPQKWKQPICPFVGKEKNLLGEPSGSMPLMTSTWPHGGILSQGCKWQLHRKLCSLDFQSPSQNDGDCGLKKKIYWNKIDKKTYLCLWLDDGARFFSLFFCLFFSHKSFLRSVSLLKRKISLLAFKLENPSRVVALISRWKVLQGGHLSRILFIPLLLLLLSRFSRVRLCATP